MMTRTTRNVGPCRLVQDPRHVPDLQELDHLDQLHFDVAPVDLRRQDHVDGDHGHQVEHEPPLEVVDERLLAVHHNLGLGVHEPRPRVDEDVNQ